MADIFISYKREEGAKVQPIVERLRSLGLSVWFDTRLPSGQAYDEEIDREARTAECVLVLWSPDAIKSDWVRAEATIGYERGVLAAAMLAPTRLYPPFNLIQAVDLSDWHGQEDHPGWISLQGRIGELTKRAELVERGGYPPSWPRKRASRLSRFLRNWDPALVALGFLIAIALASFLVDKFVRSQDFSNEYDIVFTGTVRGLAERDRVLFNGVDVGQVDDIRIDPENTNRVLVRVSVSADVPLKTDSHAALEISSATGIATIDLTPGAPDAELLRRRFAGPPPRLDGGVGPNPGASGSTGKR